MSESRQRLRKLIALSAIRQLLTQRQLVSFQMPLNNDSTCHQQRRTKKRFCSKRKVFSCQFWMLKHAQTLQLIDYSLLCFCLINLTPQTHRKNIKVASASRISDHTFMWHKLSSKILLLGGGGGWRPQSHWSKLGMGMNVKLTILKKKILICILVYFTQADDIPPEQMQGKNWL